MSWGLYASSLERKQEKLTVGMRWEWCRGCSHIDKSWPSRLLPPPWMCPRDSKIEPCSFWADVVTSRWTSVSFWWMAFSITGGSDRWALSALSARFRIFVFALRSVHWELWGREHQQMIPWVSTVSEVLCWNCFTLGFLSSVTSRWCNIPCSPEWINTDFQYLLVGIIYWILECLLCWCNTWIPCSHPVLGALCWYS